MQTGPSADARLRLLAPLGHGGMSDVWLGSLRGPAGFDKLVAVKQLRFVDSPEYDRGEAFLREARLAAMLNHPNIVQTFEVVAQGGDYRLVMEFLEGQPLNRILRKSEYGLPLPDLVRIVADVLAGLHYAHELADREGNALNVVHCDISPHNIFVTWDGNVKLVDFGIAAFGRPEATDDGLVKGKLTYMAPEQATGEPVDRRSDLFSVGVMLWEVLARGPMWGRNADPLVFTELVAGNVPSIDQAAPKAPLALRKVCMRALRRVPGERFATAAAMREALEAWMLANGGRPGQQALGDRVSTLFSADRERIKTILAQSLATADEGTDETDLHAPTPAHRRRTPIPALRANLPVPERRSQWILPVTSALSAAFIAAVAVVVVGVVVVAAAWVAMPPGPTAKARAVQVLSQAFPGLFPGLAPRASGCPPFEGRPVVELSGVLEERASLGCDRTYRLTGVVRVPPGAELTIAPDTLILGEPDGVLAVMPGGRIVARGTPMAPITFGPVQPGAHWGGVVVMGRAPTNKETPRFKGLSPDGDVFGGDREDDASGVLQYLVINDAGVELAPNNATNGLTLAGVGRGTVVDHIVVQGGGDDCFQWFGGTVSSSHLICIDPGDDGFDIELGYRGSLSNLVVMDRLPGNIDRQAIEVDNDAGNQDASPRTAPHIREATLCTTQQVIGAGTLVRRGAEGRYEGFWVDGYRMAFEIRDHVGLTIADLAVSDRTAPGVADGGGVSGIREAGRCGMPPIGGKALTTTDRWDRGWVKWE